MKFDQGTYGAHNEPTVLSLAHSATLGSLLSCNFWCQSQWCQGTSCRDPIQHHSNLIHLNRKKNFLGDSEMICPIISSSVKSAVPVCSLMFWMFYASSPQLDPYVTENGSVLGQLRTKLNWVAFWARDFGLRQAESRSPHTGEAYAHIDVGKQLQRKTSFVQK